jgi:hypothetical protein
MSFVKSLVVAAVAGAAMMMFAPTSWAQGISGPGLLGPKFIAVDGYKYGGGLPVGVDKNLDALRVLIKAADAMGQLRDNQYGGSQYLVLGDTTNAMRMVANGKVNGQPAHVVIDWDLRVPGIRIDVQSPDGKTRNVQVAAKKLAWDESSPGIYGGPAQTSVEERLAIAYLMPSGVVLGGRDAADKIKLGKDGARTTMTYPVAALGTDVTATLDADGHPVHTQLALNGKTYTGDFENFLNDRADDEVKFPHTVMIKVDGKPMFDLNLDWHQANPYLIFPVPKEVASK